MSTKLFLTRFVTSLVGAFLFLIPLSVWTDIPGWGGFLMAVGVILLGSDPHRGEQ